MRKVFSSLHWIDSINEWVGRIVSFFTLAIIVVVIFEVAMRYFFVQSQLWASETSLFLFGALCMLSGGYIFLHNGHVKLDVVYQRFSGRTKSIIDLITFIPFLVFCVVLIWMGWLMAWDSLITLETSPSDFAPPLFPIKLTIPIGAGLLLIQGIVKFIGDLHNCTHRAEQ